MASLPPVDDMLAMKFTDLVDLCESLSIQENFEKRFDCQRPLLRYYHEKGLIEPQQPLFSPALKQFSNEYDQNKVTIRHLIDRVQEFVTADENVQLFRRLGLHEASSNDKFVKLRSELSREKPAILVAGSTSSGKSTLINAFLGEHILVTDYNASTKTRCEIKYSENGTKYAVVNFNTDHPSIVLNLSNSRHRQELEDHMTRKTTESSSNTDLCSFVEIFWPQEFLQYMTLVDSPGTTDDLHYREITERYQKNQASGFIYVINAMDSAEVAERVGELKQAFVDPDVPKIARTAIYVVNKWDMFCRQNKGVKEQNEYLEKLRFGLSNVPIDFGKVNLVTMDATLAAEASKVGVSSQDMRKLSSTLERLLPATMKENLTKTVKELREPIRGIEDQLENTIREMNLPLEQRKMKQTRDMEQIKGFQNAFEECKTKLEQNLEEHVHRLYEHMAQGRGREIVLDDLSFSEHKMGKRSTARDNELLEKRVICAVRQYQGYSDMEMLLKSREVRNELEVIIERFTSVTLQVNQHSDVVNMKEEIYKEIGKRLAIIAAGVVILPITVVAGSVWLIDYFRTNRRLQSSLPEQYEEYLKCLKKDEYSKLKKFIVDLATDFSGSVRFVYKRIPHEIKRLEEELEARMKKEHSENLPKYKDLYQACQPFIEELSQFMAENGIHDFREEDVSWPGSGPTPVDSGAYGCVYEARIRTPDRRGDETTTKIAIKVLYPRMEGMFSEFLKERNHCRRFNHPNVVRLFGSTIFANFQGQGSRLALLFEWCDNGSLRNEIFDANYHKPANEPRALVRGNQIIRQLTNGLSYLHDLNIVHRDIKPENILLDKDGCVKIADMGLVKPVSLIKGTLVGTLDYLAPEVLSKQPYSTPADIYSLGVVLFEVWFGERSDDVRSDSVPAETPLPEKITKLKWSQHNDDTRPGKQWKSWVERCTSAPDERPTAPKLLREVSNWESLLNY